MITQTLGLDLRGAYTAASSAIHPPLSRANGALLIDRRNGPHENAAVVITNNCSSACYMSACALVVMRVYVLSLSSDNKVAKGTHLGS